MGSSLLEHHADAGGIAVLGIQGAAGNFKLLQGIGGRQRDQAEAVGAGPPAIGSVLDAHAVQIPIVASPVAAARDHRVTTRGGRTRHQADQCVDGLTRFRQVSHNPGGNAGRNGLRVRMNQRRLAQDGNGLLHGAQIEFHIHAHGLGTQHADAGHCMGDETSLGDGDIVDSGLKLWMEYAPEESAGAFRGECRSRHFSRSFTPAPSCRRALEIE